ncbi:hypothetical protein, partial [Streptomyces venezuelae]|uniref:hypothetical protein n=1 Tax=Streptomyces venezuelae TaxID=54571 RepID=UPI001F165880
PPRSGAVRSRTAPDRGGRRVPSRAAHGPVHGRSRFDACVRFGVGFDACGYIDIGAPPGTRPLAPVGGLRGLGALPGQVVGVGAEGSGEEDAAARLQEAQRSGRCVGG